jgi:hypothetical protein
MFALALAFLFALGQQAPQKPAPPASITGKWAMTLEMPTGTATPSLELVQSGEKVSGSYQGRYGKFPVTGSLKKNALVFSFTMNAEGQEVVMTFTGEVAADLLSMKGTADMPGLGEAAWSAKRAEK